MGTASQTQYNDSQASHSGSLDTPSFIPNQPQVIQQPYTEPPRPKSKLKKIFLIVGAFILFGVIGFGYLLFQGVKDAPEVKAKVSNFMQYVSNNDLDNAYTLTSSEFKHVTPKEEFARAMNVFKAQHAGFKDQEQTGFSIEANAGQAVRYKYSGVIEYTDGDKGEISAILVKEDGEYKILYFEVNVDIKRLEKFQQQSNNSVLGVGTSD